MKLLNTKIRQLNGAYIIPDSKIKNNVIPFPNKPLLELIRCPRISCCKTLNLDWSFKRE